MALDNSNFERYNDGDSSVAQLAERSAVNR